MPKRSKVLTNDVKALIVDRIAQFLSPQEVVDEIKRQFGIELNRQTIERYDPSKVAGVNLSKRWRVLFDARRRAYLSAVENVPIANLAVRLQWLQDMVLDLKAMRNYLGAARLLEQAAREVGGAYAAGGRPSGGTGDGGPPVPDDQPKSPGPEHWQELAKRYHKGLAVVQGGKS